jgi:hypothetical protein
LNLPYFFHSEVFLKHQGNPILFGANGYGNSVELAVFEENGRAKSPLKAPFGSFSRIGKPGKELFSEVLQKIETWAKETQIQSLSLVLPPDCYQSEGEDSVLEVLLSHGYKISWQDLNYHFKVENPFFGKLHRSERWKLQRSSREGFQFQPIANIDWDFVFPFLLQSRLRRGYSLSMTREELEAVFKAFPENYRCWGVYFRNQCVALSVTVRVNQKIEYVFYTADDADFRKFSPVVLLHSGIYSNCAESGIELLDLGTSSLRGIINDGVSDFKRHLGALTSSKTTLIRHFENKGLTN